MNNTISAVNPNFGIRAKDIEPPKTLKEETGNLGGVKLNRAGKLGLTLLSLAALAIGGVIYANRNTDKDSSAEDIITLTLENPKGALSGFSPEVYQEININVDISDRYKRLAIKTCLGSITTIVNNSDNPEDALKQIKDMIDTVKRNNGKYRVEKKFLKQYMKETGLADIDRIIKHSNNPEAALEQIMNVVHEKEASINYNLADGVEG